METSLEQERTSEEEQTRRIAIIADLAAAVAHEFNNVLMGIAPFAEIVGRNAKGDERLVKASAQIRSAVARGRRITQDITRFARPIQPKLDRVDIGALLRACLVRLQPSLPGGSCELELPDTPLHVRADAQQVDQAVTDLLLNARDALGGTDGGYIKVRVAAPAGPDESPLVRIDVEDNGRGIPPEHLQRIFDPFFTTKRTGTGLGLTVVKQIATAHGGCVAVASVPSVKTTFSLFLPLDLSDREDAPSVPDAEVLRGRAVLLVEDDEAVAEGLLLLLEVCGAEVRHAATAADAIALVSARPFDCVLLDVALPDARGYEVFAKLRSLRPEVPVVFSSGSGDDGVLSDLLRLPRVGHLTKPYELEALLDAVGRVLRE